MGLQLFFAVGEGLVVVVTVKCNYRSFLENGVSAGSRFEIVSAALYENHFFVLHWQPLVTWEVLFGFYLVNSNALLFVLVNHCRMERLLLFEIPAYLGPFNFSFFNVSAKGTLGRQSLGYFSF